MFATWSKAICSDYHMIVMQRWTSRSSLVQLSEYYRHKNEKKILISGQDEKIRQREKRGAINPLISRPSSL